MDKKEDIIKLITDLLKRANRNNMKSKYIYIKILTSLKNFHDPINTLEDLDKIKNIGKKTKELIYKEVFQQKNMNVEVCQSSNIVYENKLLNSSFLDIMERNSKEKDKIHVEENKNDLNININNKKSNNEIDVKKEGVIKYVPSFKSGAYAILKVLSKEEGISKHIICHRGSKYCSTEFNFNQRYSAWSSIKTLVSKKLVHKEEKKYFLTDMGRSTVNYLFDGNSTLIQEMTEPILTIDSREIKSKKDRSFFQRELEKDIRCETRNLLVGDFLWVYDEFILDFIVERKKGSDFCSSIADGRFNEQKKRLKNTGINHIFYIVEGLKDRDLQKIGIKFGYSCLAATKMEGLTVIETEDINETIEIVKLIDEVVKSKFKRSKFVDDNCEYLKLRYDDFIDKGTKHNNLKISDIFLISLLSIRGLSYEKGKCVAEKYITLSNFIKLDKENNIYDELCKLKTSKGVLGKTLAKKICKIILNKN